MTQAAYIIGEWGVTPRSQANFNCVEVMLVETVRGRTFYLVRSSRHPEAGLLRFTPTQWQDNICQLASAEGPFESIDWGEPLVVPLTGSAEYFVCSLVPGRRFDYTWTITGRGRRRPIIPFTWDELTAWQGALPEGGSQYFGRSEGVFISPKRPLTSLTLAA